ncbi:MAG: DUF2934 domain-containing protein [Thiohalocapsa sp.]|jgi:hypothetical protein|uniref:DUF2934 domain-containing protein n=1 Tax=Thiohalocapsa sp. TaxID=2497641 RepID=UPI0025DBEA03|nr:DUF2934 domain-containing protein [Thiohalocapsa sp.]MCG6942547.1 DUF2934 domain-containing protein [Thiohalocapsa sp.]
MHNLKPDRSAAAKIPARAHPGIRSGAHPGTHPEEHPGAVTAPRPDTEAAARRLRECHRCRVADRAYFLAEARGFAPGHELDDWLAAERVEDALERPI